VLALDRPSGDPSARSTNPPVVLSSSRPMTQVGQAHDPMTASVALTSVAWGTKLDLTCSYPRGTVDYEGGTYVLVVHTADGKSEHVATWNGLPGKSMHVSGATAAWTDNITSVEVTKLDGSPVAELAL
jgi:hypothetical protein